MSKPDAELIFCSVCKTELEPAPFAVATVGTPNEHGTQTIHVCAACGEQIINRRRARGGPTTLKVL